MTVGFLGVCDRFKKIKKLSKLRNSSKNDLSMAKVKFDNFYLREISWA